MLPRARTAAPGSLSADAVVPLVPRRRIIGLPFGEARSLRREGSYDLIGSRRYRPGDDPRRIDRHASAKLSAVSNEDELIVREHLAEERVAVGLVVDDSPTMALHPVSLPWLDKPAAVAAVDRIVTASAQRSRSPLVRLAAFVADAHAGPLRTGSIVFLVSDFLRFPPDEAWDDALALGWDVVPLVVQDPTWERSFPDVGGVTLPLADPDGSIRPVLLRRREAARRRDGNESRFATIISRLEELGLEPVVIATADLDGVHDALLAWAEDRRSTFAWTA